LLLKVFSFILGISFLFALQPAFGETAIIQVSNNGTIWFTPSGIGDGVACPTTTTGSSFPNNMIAQSDGSGFCYIGIGHFDISGIPDGATVTDVKLNATVTAAGGIDENIDFRYVTVDLDTATNQEIADSGRTGTVYVDGSASCTASGNNVQWDLGATADTNLQSELTGDDEFAISLFEDNFQGFGNGQSCTLSAVRLVVTYTATLPDFTINQQLQNIGDIERITGTITMSAGDPQPNVTSIVIRVNGTIINTNSTNHNQTVPYTISYGPVWNQMTVDTPRNYTTTVTVQQSWIDYLNEDKDYDVRDYDPDYFAAVVASEGGVNYTKGSDFGIKVNRDKSGVPFQIECACLDYADGFLNRTDVDEWNNETSVGAYQYTCSAGTFLTACYNDNLLFTTSYPANSSTILVSGTAIFDQIGGFMGAPAALLVVLAIYSLGTGRNFPIISVVAMSALGVMGALGLMVLSGQIWALLLVITGLSIFGVRKFF
jgi:hypothetical protein